MRMDIRELEIKLEKAKGQLNEALAQSRTKHTPIESFQILFEAVESAERELAQAKELPFAERFEICFKPDAAVPTPVLLESELSTFLVFNPVRKGGDGKYHKCGTAIVEFKRCTITKFGYPNDEALPGHPLYAAGLRPYAVFKVQNSAWKKEITEQNRVTFPNTPDSKKSHFIITFHDSIFECIAEDLIATLSPNSIEQILTELLNKIIPRWGV
jgi:hypothetical protein